MRAFIGVHIDAKTVDEISAVVNRLKDRLTGIRWVQRENLHLTVKFLGEIDESQTDSIVGVLEEALRPFSHFTINAKSLGVFPGLKRPQILWVGLQGDPLISLAAAVDKALEPLGFPREKRSFKPHLTIGRWRESTARRGRPVACTSAPLDNAIASWNEYEFGKSVVDELVLFQSVLGPQGAMYRPLRVIAL